MIEILAAAYLDGANCPPSEHELGEFINWIEIQYNSISCRVQFWDGDISLSECKNAFASSGILNISTANNFHPYLSTLQNARFRAVHDWHHIALGVDDSFAGEFATWHHNDASDCIQWILFSEIVLQAAAAIYTGEFQPQKLVKIPGF